MTYLKPTLTAGLAMTLLTGLSGCIGGGGNGAMLASQSLSSLAGANQPVSDADLAKSCEELDADLTRFYARIEELNKAEKARQRKAGLLDGALQIGIGALAGNALTGAGSVDEINNIKTATAAATTAVDVASIGGADEKSWNQANALIARTTTLERAKLQKSCP